jgi:hypothetical protein
MEKPFTQGITIESEAYTVLEPGGTARLDFHMARGRGEGRHFPNRQRKLQATRTLNMGFPEVRIVPQVRGDLAANYGLRQTSQPDSAAHTKPKIMKMASGRVQ